MAPVVISALIVGFIAWAIMLSRQQSQRKKEAIASLQEEKESLSAFSIHALVEAEVADLGLAEIDGAKDIPAEILLKTWNTSQHIVAKCRSRESLRFTTAEGVQPGNATERDVDLVCDDPEGALSPESNDAAVEPPAETDDDR